MQKTLNSRNHGLVLFDPKIGLLSGATTPDQSGPGNNGNEGVLCIPQSSSITGTSPSDCLVSYPGHLLRWGVLLLCREVVGVFYSPSWQGNTTLDQNGNEGVLCIPQSSSTTAASPSNCIVSYLGHIAAEIQWVYSTAPTDWAATIKVSLVNNYSQNPLNINKYFK